MKLKGKTIIELTNVVTGEVEVVEETNFITNAIRDMCQPILRNQDALPTTIFKDENGCSIEALMRGLLLFDKKFDENTANYFPPVTAKMVGHGGPITYSGSDLTMGSFNVNQSILSGDVERSYVWDFTAEQANGVINSICLTTQCGGIIGYGSETRAEESAASLKSYTNIIKSAIMTKWADTLQQYEKVPVYLDFENDCIIFCDYSKFSVGRGVFYKVSLDSKVVDIFSKIPSATRVVSWDVPVNVVGNGLTKVEVVSFDFPSDFGTGTIFGLAQDGQYLYVTSKLATGESLEANAWAAGTTIKVLKINLETFGTEELSVTNTTGATLAIRTTYSNLAGGNYTFGVSNGYMFVRQWVSATGDAVADLYAISLLDNTDVKKVQSVDGRTKLVGIHNVTLATPFLMSIQGRVSFVEKGRIPSYSVGASTPLSIVCCVSTDDFTVKYLNTSSQSLYSQGAMVPQTSIGAKCYPTSNKLYFGVERRLSSEDVEVQFVNVTPTPLMTINNLNSPVEKTPAQTMRITYKLIKE